MVKNYIRDIRLDRDMTQEDLADAMGTTHVTVQRHETGKRNLTHAWIERYASALNCQPRHILEGIVSSSTELDEDEKKLLENYRRMNDKEQDIYLSMASSFLREDDLIAKRKTDEDAKKHGTKE